jgi:hypothetical protein
MPELWHFLLILRNFLVRNSLDPSLFHILPYLLLNLGVELKLATKTLFRNIKEEETEAGKL